MPDSVSLYHIYLNPEILATWKIFVDQTLVLCSEFRVVWFLRDLHVDIIDVEIKYYWNCYN